MTSCLSNRSAGSPRVAGPMLTLACAAALTGLPQVGFSQATSSWVHYDAHGRLQYATDSLGNRIIDYSTAGYRGGGVALPMIPARTTVSPSGGDDTAAIQAAIDAVAALEPDQRGFRGAVLLSPGTFNVSATLHITAGGVVLAGSGSGTGGSLITMTGSPFTLLAVSGSGSYVQGPAVSMTDSYVPSGATSFNVSDASGFSVGEPVLINRPVTAAWVHFVGMDTLVRNGLPQTWIAPGSVILTDRSITAIHGNRISIDAPLTDSFDSQFLSPPGGTVASYTFAGRIAEVGIEHLAIVAPTQAAVTGRLMRTGSPTLNPEASLTLKLVAPEGT